MSFSVLLLRISEIIGRFQWFLLAYYNDITDGH